MLRQIGDDVADVLKDLNSRRGRSVLLVAAVALSTGALVTSFGVSETASRQISSDLAAAILDEISVTGAQGGGISSEPLFPPGAEERAMAVPGVTAAGLRLDLELSVARPRRFWEGQARTDLQVFGATAGYLAAIDSDYDSNLGWALDETDPYSIVLLGVAAASELGIPVGFSGPGYRIYVNGHPAEVVGVVGGLMDRDISRAVIVPYREAVMVAGGDSTARMIVATAPGSGAAVSDVIRAAVRPDMPSTLTASRVVDLKDTRRGVQSQLARLAGASGLLLLALTGLLMANAMVVSVVSRLPEIGLRRALGASRTGVLRLFLLEGGLVGALGGLGGSAIGLWSTLVVSLANGWSPELSPAAAAFGLFLGIGTGLLGSGYPASRASRVNPAEAIRFD